MFFKSFSYSAARLMCVRTVRELTFLRKLEYLTEVACQLFTFYIKGSESLDTRCVNKISTHWQLQHLTECSCVHTRVMYIGIFAVRRLTWGRRALIIVDFPTPLLPLKRVTFSANNGFSFSTLNSLSARHSLVSLRTDNRWLIEIHYCMLVT